MELERHMIVNIVDRRSNPYRWKIIDAVFEASWHDNALHDAGHQLEPESREPSYGARKHLSLTEAVTWASAVSGSVTLYLYDAGSNAVPDGWTESSST